MDIGLLSKMIRELILENDRVGMPGLGTFSADIAPAAFSDKGYTINPPYRRLSFSTECLEDSLLADMYAKGNGLDYDSSKLYLTNFFMEMAEVLKRKKTINLPGLGRLRATKENEIFFIADENPDIFPDGIGLEPVSLKTRVQDYEEIHIEVKKPLARRGEETPEKDLTESGNEKKPLAKRGEETPESSGESGTTIETEPGTKPGTKPSEKKRRGKWVPALYALAAVIIALAAFVILARIAPDFIDSILYTPEELQIINFSSPALVKPIHRRTQAGREPFSKGRRIKEKQLPEFTKDKNYEGFKTQVDLLEFGNKNSNKGYALEKVCELFDVKLDECMAFGDTTNDNQMLKVCNGVCMLNGSDDTKACAKYITDIVCDEDGFADYIEKHLL